MEPGPTGAPWDERDRTQWALLAARLSLAEPLLHQAWADPARGPGCDLAGVLVRFGALSAEHANALRQHQSGAPSNATRADPPTPPATRGDFRTVEVSAPAVVARPEPPSQRSSGAGDPASATTAPQLGSRIGPYELVAELGQGGMGLVYEARTETLAEPVALKLLPFGQSSDRARERFEIEGQTMLRLRHRNIVRVLDLRADPGLSYMALELVRGGSLKDHLDKSGGVLPVEEAMELGAVLADALDYAHQRGVIHRDMKPANVLIHEDGTPLITDFGLAKEVESKDQGLTRSGDMLGTPGYMAPEQIESSAFVDGRADIYGLGVTLFRCLTGRLPFDSDNTLALMAAVLASDPPALRRVDSSLPVDVETIVARCLAREPERRYSSAAELAEDCRRVLRKEPVTAIPIGMRERLELWQRRHQKTLLAAGLVTVLLLASGAAVLVQKARADASRRAEEVARRAQTRAEEARQRAEAASKRAESEKARAESETSRAESERARAESTLKQVQAVKTRLEQSQEELVQALDEGRLNVCRSFIERARGEMLTENDTRAAVYAAEAAGQAQALKGERARRLESVALGRLRSALFHSPLVWRREPPLGWSPTMVATSADGSTLAVASNLRAAVWDLRTGALLTTVSAALRPHRGLALSPDGATLAIGQGGVPNTLDPSSAPPPVLRLFDLRGETEPRLMTLDAACLSLCYRGASLYSLTASGALRRHDGADQRIIQEAKLPRGLTGADISEDGEWMALACQGLLAFAPTDDLTSLAQIGFRGRIRMLALAASRRTAIIVALRGGLIRLDGDAKPLWQVEAKARHAAVLGDRIATIEDTGLCLRSLANGTRIGEPIKDAVSDPHTSVHRLSENSVLLADRAGLRVFDLDSRKVRLQTPQDLGALGLVTGSASAGVLSLGRGLVDLRTGRKVGQLEYGWQLLGPPDRRIDATSKDGIAIIDSTGHAWRPKLSQRVNVVCQSQNGACYAFGWFASRGFGGPPVRFQLWNRKSRRPIGDPVPVESGITPTVSDTGRLAAVVSGKGVIYEPGGPGVVGRYAEAGMTRGLLISPDGEWIAIQRLNPTGLWLRRTTATGAGVCIVPGLFQVAAAFSPDSQRLAFVSSERVVEVCRLPDFTLERRLTGHADAISGIEFSRGGARLVSRGGDVRCWAVPEPDERAPVPLPSDFVERQPGNIVEQPAALGGDDAGTRFGVRKARQYRILDSQGRTVWSSGEATNAIGLIFAPDGRRALARSKSALILLDAERGEELSRASATGRSGTLNTPGHSMTVGTREVLSLSAKRTILALDRGNGALREQPFPALGGIVRLRLSPDESKLAFAELGRVGVLATKDLSVLWQRRLEVGLGEIRSLGFRAEAVLVSTGPLLLRFRPEDGHPLPSVELDVAPLEDTRISADGLLIAGLVRGGRPALWDTATGSRYLLTARSELKVPSVGDMAMAFSAGGRLLHFTETDRIRVFDTKRVRDALAATLPEDPRAMVQRRTGLRLEGFTLSTPAAPALRPPP